MHLISALSQSIPKILQFLSTYLELTLYSNSKQYRGCFFSAIGALFCLLLFLLVKLLSVHHATSSQIAFHCGVDVAQFLLFESASVIEIQEASAISSYQGHNQDLTLIA
jgi:hypothetical protein